MLRFASCLTRDGVAGFRRSILPPSLLAVVIMSVGGPLLARTSVDSAIKTFNAAVSDASKVKALCAMFADMEKLAQRPDAKTPGSSERAMNTIIARLPADLRAAVQAEDDLPVKDRGNDRHPYYQAMEKVVSKCVK